MADRYWVGGAGTWDGSATTHWSASSGGAAGASAPVSTDNVIFDASSGLPATVTVAATAACNNCTVTGPASKTQTFTLSGTWTVTGTLTMTADPAMKHH